MRKQARQLWWKRFNIPILLSSILVFPGRKASTASSMKGVSLNCLPNKCVGRPAVALLVAICHVVNLLSTATRSKTHDARVIGTSLILGILNAWTRCCFKILLEQRSRQARALTWPEYVFPVQWCRVQGWRTCSLECLSFFSFSWKLCFP